LLARFLKKMVPHGEKYSAPQQNIRVSFSTVRGTLFECHTRPEGRTLHLPSQWNVWP
jgi:hypothetical protein